MSRLQRLVKHNCKPPKVANRWGRYKWRCELPNAGCGAEWKREPIIGWYCNETSKRLQWKPEEPA